MKRDRAYRKRCVKIHVAACPFFSYNKSEKYGIQSRPAGNAVNYPILWSLLQSFKFVAVSEGYFSGNSGPS